MLTATPFFVDHPRVSVPAATSQVTAPAPVCTPAVDPFHHTAIDAVIFQAHNAQWDSVVGALAAGFQVNSVCSVTGATLLHFAAWHGHLPMVRELLGAGADPNARSKTGATPVWRAARYGTAAALRELVEAGGDVNAADENGSTPLVTLVRNNVGDAAERLLVLLAAPTLDLHATSSGKSAVQWAREAGHHHLADLVQAEVRGDYLAGLDWFVGNLAMLGSRNQLMGVLFALGGVVHL